ncbi:MAG: Nucleotide binding protein PINc [Segetibacter sp.]|nr:Nucleotide binding protein PINc [Segetibacter sp.]
MIVVFDTNTLISASLFPSSIPGRCVSLSLERSGVIYSEQTITELISVIYYPKFDKYLSSDDRSSFLKSYINLAKKINVTSSITACRDSKDNKFLELAVDGNAEYIITGDKDLLVLHPFRNISIITPASFLEMVSIK